MIKYAIHSKLRDICHQFMFFIHLALWSNYVHAQSTVFISGDDKWQKNLMEELVILADEKKELSVQHILANPGLPFKTNEGVKPTGHHYWAKAIIANTSEKDLRLFFGSFFWDYVKIYITNGEKMIDSVSIGIQSKVYQPNYTIKKQATLFLFIEFTASGMFRREENVNLVIQNSIYLLKKNSFHNYLDGMVWGALLGLTLYNLFLFISLRDRLYLWYCIYAISATLFVGSTFSHSPSLLRQYFMPSFPQTAFFIKKIFDPLAWIAILQFSRHFLQLNEKLPSMDKIFKTCGWGLVLMFSINCLGLYQFNGPSRIIPYAICMSLGFFTALFMYYKDLFKGWYFIIAQFFLFIASVLAVLYYFKIDYLFFLGKSDFTEYLKSIKFNFMWYIGELTFFSFALSHKYNSLQQSIHEAKLQQELEKQNLLQMMTEALERQISERTEEIKTSIQQIKVTQAQLIHTEKMASLGELTSGVAHEIQNPLNFINNFSEINIDILDELGNGANLNNGYENTLSTIKKNADKILFHGHRIDNIVKGMLQHASQSMQVKEFTNINLLCEESLKLAYHAFRAKISKTEATNKNNITYDYLPDTTVPNTEVIVQEFSRAFLNLCNNAFYACHAKSNSESLENYHGIVKLSTRYTDGLIKILVSDNGTGIPESIQTKIFQPFFTTKPVGEGTGLGLSLAYDIITKGHGGTIEVRSTENEGTEFEISLPVNLKK